VEGEAVGAGLVPVLDLEVEGGDAGAPPTQRSRGLAPGPGTGSPRGNEATPATTGRGARPEITSAADPATASQDPDHELNHAMLSLHPSVPIYL